jgi:hypothetical protein
MSDPRVVAMAREWCRILAKEPDEIIGRGKYRAPRWQGYAHLMERLLGAMDREGSEALIHV